MPPPNMDYFVGAWTFEWNVPESPLGPAGKLKGTETYKKLSNGNYESEIEGEGPSGALKARATTVYNEKDKLVTRTESGLFGVTQTKDRDRLAAIWAAITRSSGKPSQSRRVARRSS
jgi:hypothetical protein